MGYCEDSALALLGMRFDLNPAIGRKGRVSSGLIIAVIALCALWAYGCASKIPRQTTEHHVYVAERTRVGEAMVTVEDVTFREGKRRACLFLGGAQFKETSSSAFREGLFYEGMSGNTIKMSHREYRRDLDNPSWVTPMKHDLSTSPVFWFLDFRVKVIEATSEAIQFVEIGRPMHHGTPQKGPSAVNIDARVNDRSFPVKLLLAAGSYKIQPVGILGGGEYNGWKSHAQGAIWFNRYCVESDEFYFCEGTSRGFTSDIMAFESARSRIFVLRKTQYVYFYIATDGHIDNAGGVSLRLEPVSAPDILVMELSPGGGPFGTKIRIKGEGFGQEQSGMMGPQEGYYSFVSFRRDNDSRSAIVTKYPFWSDEEITVILEDLFFDQNGDSLKDGNETLLDVDGLAPGKYYVTVHTVWFHDGNNNGIYDGRHERHLAFPGNAQVFEVIGVEPVADPGRASRPYGL